ncbi:MAG TPA: RHS repeat domain-containing protein, partial [Alphaproteobacteria bacterium]|nr:RHS repeat domain-containing protein [Alphaproteobacteria bacterium]
MTTLSYGVTTTGGTTTTVNANNAVLSSTDTQTTSTTYNLNAAALGGNSSPITASYYSDSGQLIGTLHQDGRLTTYQYDAGGNLIGQRVHANPPLAPLWSQDFSLNTDGIDPMHAGFMTQENGALTITSRSDLETGWLRSFGTRTHPFTDAVVFRAEVTTGARSSGRRFDIGAGNTAGERFHAAYFFEDAIYVSFFDGDWQDVQLGWAENNTSYVIEIATHAQGSTLYIYPKGTDRQSGLIHSLTFTDWGNARLFMDVEGSSGLAGNAAIRLDNVSEATSLGALVGPWIAVESAQDSISDGSSYTIQPSDTWSSIAATLYGSSSVADELQTALDNPPLTAGNRLTNLPGSLTDTVTTTTTVAPYYTVQASDTWASITQTVYGTSDANAVSTLQSSLGNPTLTTGLRLTVP